MTPRERTDSVLAACRDEHGFAFAGVSSIEPSAWGDELRVWLADGKHGSMDYLERNLDTRLNPAALLDGANAAIVVGDLYAARADNIDSPLGPHEGRVARYARGRDYHKVIKKRLHALSDTLHAQHPKADFRACVDTAPVLERELASRAGLGWTGKHTLTIHPREGSYFLLGVLLTTLELESNGAPEPDHCGTCTRCIEACPTQAITPYSVDGSKCLSYLTIEHREPVGPGFDFSGWVFGCDICQEVCPHNSPRETSMQPHEAYATRRDRFDLLEVLGWSETDRREAFTTSAMKRATLPMMKRNALLVLSEREPDETVRERVRTIAEDSAEDEMVRDAAAAVLKRWLADGGS